MQPTPDRPTRRSPRPGRSRHARLLGAPLAATGLALLVWAPALQAAPAQPVRIHAVPGLRRAAAGNQARMKAAQARRRAAVARARLRGARARRGAAPIRAKRRDARAHGSPAPRPTPMASTNKAPTAKKRSPYRPRAVLLKAGDPARKHASPAVRARAGDLAMAGARQARAKPKTSWLSLIVFFLLAFGCAGFAVVMITRRSPMMSALSLLVVFLCLAGLYVMLRAPFMAAIQLIVYAGAIIVLFVFVIMSMGLKEAYGHREMTRDVAYFMSGFLLSGAGGLIWVYGSGVPALGIALLLWAATLALFVVGQVEHPMTRFAGIAGASFAAAHLLKLATLSRTYLGDIIQGGTKGHSIAVGATTSAGFGDPQAVGRSVFGGNVFAFEALSLLLLAAVVAAVVIVRSRKEAA